MSDHMMIEHSIALKILSTIGSGLLWMGVALGIPHAFEFIILQVDQHIFLTPYVRILMDEIKQVLVLTVEFFVLVKVIVGIKNSLKKKGQAK